VRKREPFLLLLYFYDVFSLQSLGTLGDSEFHRVALVERPESSRLNRRVMYKNVIAGSALNEPIALGVVKPLYRALFFFHLGYF